MTKLISGNYFNVRTRNLCDIFLKEDKCTIFAPCSRFISDKMRLIASKVKDSQQEALGMPPVPHHH